MTSSHGSSHSSSHTSSYSNSHSNSHTNSHTNHGNHANTVTTVGTITPNNHSVSIGVTSITESDLPSRLSTVPSATGTLDVLRRAALEARNSLTKPNYVSEPSGVQSANQSTITNLLNYSGGRHIKYAYSTSGINMNITYNNNGTTGHANTGNLTNAVTSPITSKSIHCNVGATNIHCNTSGSDWQSPKVNYTFPQSSISVTTGSKIQSARTPAQILATIKKVTASTLSAQSWTSSGNATYIYQNSYSNSHGNSHANTHGNSHTNSHSNSSTSSRLKKKNILPLNLEALELIDKINLVSFSYRPESGEDPTIQHYGFIAEDTNEIFATKYHDRMDYMNCIGILLKAVQELNYKLQNIKK